MLRAIRMLSSLLVLVAGGTIWGTSQSLDSVPAKQFSTITIHMKCEAMRPDYCQGFYGFSIASDGRFKAGPDANGNTIEGSITGNELTSLASSVNDQLASGNKTTNLEIHVMGVS